MLVVLTSQAHLLVMVNQLARLRDLRREGKLSIDLSFERLVLGSLDVER